MSHRWMLRIAVVSILAAPAAIPTAYAADDAFCKDYARAAINQMRSIISTAPDELRSGLRGLPIPRLIACAAGLRPGGRRDVVSATKLALRCLARRAQELENELEILDAELAPLVAATAPELVSRHGVGTDTAGAILVAAGDNAHRLRTEADVGPSAGACERPEAAAVRCWLLPSA